MSAPRHEIAAGRRVGALGARRRGLAAWLCGAAVALAGPAVLAQPAPAPRQVPETQRVVAAPAPLGGVIDLPFRNFYRLPIGPRGLEPSAALLALNGRRVRLVGYMARLEAKQAAPGVWILAPLPVTLGDEDDGFADDLPAANAYVHLARPSPLPLPYLPGLLAFTGTLQLGGQPEPDGRWSFVRLQLDADASALIDPLPVPFHATDLPENTDAAAR